MIRGIIEGEQQFFLISVEKILKIKKEKQDLLLLFFIPFSD